jgi:GNAT superfamily N-acetyltransferase
VITDEDQVIGSGTIRQIDTYVCELKRQWLLEKYQGKGIGIRVLQELILFAQSKGYTKMYPETDSKQKRATGFYQRASVQESESYNTRNRDLYMSLDI